LRCHSVASRCTVDEGPPPPPPPPTLPLEGCGWVAATTTAQEYDCRCEEVAPPDPIGAGAIDKEAAIVDPFCLDWFCIPDLPTFDALPMGSSLLDVTEPLLFPRGVILDV
jgi:hypothetical protein